MASNYWIKLYYEVIDDPKMGRLSDRLWRRFFELCLLAAEQQDEGYLPSVEDMAWRLRLTADEMSADLQALANTKRDADDVGLVQLRDETWFVTNLSKRQAAVPPNERKRKQRERDHKDEYYCHEPVTTRDTEEEREVEEEREEESSAIADPPISFSTFPEWQEHVRSSKGQPGGSQAAIRRMTDVLYPGLDPPSFSYIAKTARRVGGFGRLADLLFQHSTRPPTGDLMTYIQGVAKSNGKNRGNHTGLGEGTGEKATTGQAAAIAAAFTAPVTDGPGRGGGGSG